MKVNRLIWEFRRTRALANRKRAQARQIAKNARKSKLIAGEIAISQLVPGSPVRSDPREGIQID